MMKNGRLAVIMLGPPGAGKGTQARMMSECLKIPHISTGDMLREALKNQTELGKKAKEFMDSGALVPDALVDEIVADRLSREDCDNGFILDGYPRTIHQAEFLRSILDKNGMQMKAIGFEVGHKELIRRLSSRWTCAKCGKMFNSEMDPTKAGGQCDECGTTLTQRKDDRADIIAERLQVYKKTTQPLIRYYRDRGVYSKVNGERSVNSIYETIKESIRKNDN